MPPVLNPEEEPQLLLLLLLPLLWLRAVRSAESGKKEVLVAGPRLTSSNRGMCVG
jgi:hypothetical protein